MMFRTHLAFALMLGLIFFRVVENKLLFIPLLLISCLIPDIDSAKSYIGNRWYLRPVQLFLKHRGMMHSFSFCVVISLIVSFIYPPLAFPFFLGYSSHLFSDGITKEGIRPFWPLKEEISWKIRTGGRTETAILLIILFVNLLLILSLFVR